MLFIGGSRFFWRMFRDAYIEKSETKNERLLLALVPPEPWWQDNCQTIMTRNYCQLGLLMMM